MMDLETHIFLVTILMVSATAAVINLTTLFAILFNKALRKRKNVFKFNLTLADCTAAIVIFIKNLVDYCEIPFYRGNFEWTTPVLVSGLLISILSTLAIAVERLIVLRYDAHRRMITAKRSIAICLIVWALILPAYTCIYKFKSETAFILGNVVFPCVIFISVAITAFCYAIIYRKIVMRPDSAMGSEALQRRAKKHEKMIITSVLIVVSTSSCWLVMCTALLIETLEEFGKIEEKFAFDVLSDVGFVLVVLNQVLNPVIMWLRLTDFRGQLNACCLNRPICRRVFGFQTLAQSDATTTSTDLQLITEVNIGMQEMPML